MPELPEVETMRRGILPILGCRITSAERPACTRRPILLQPRIDAFDRRVRDRVVVNVGRRGKRVTIHLDDSQTIVIEPRMTGLVLLAEPPTTDHLRLRLNLSAGSTKSSRPNESTGAGESTGSTDLGGPIDQLLFWDRRGLGTVRLLHPAEMASMVDAKLGADALCITAEQLRENLGSSRRAIKVALLDQAAVAGIGNLYAAEILFLAGIDPRTRCDKLSRVQWQRIQECTLNVLEDAIEHEGSTLSDGTYRNALNTEGSYQNHHRVYDRADVPCGRCGKANIRRIVQAQRSTFFCPICQRKSGLHETVTIR
ncbi:Formamidopyrimidine-DNA glycosylase [Rubripirellula amarantea]|uniref:Formamidopyrimidine-DNA glycosylase n=1 Tax=Rubripirellula amarantea TaxID=2527999 RepID=A0A5C5WSS8_9BACT|nr:DNA-formamidopyrimidine glycosylase family protein [Rubripirellula amarantea]TWT53211.1 Formamidopyrimidine-DNA glycosylase [Rubripirellula amarantea]